MNFGELDAGLNALDVVRISRAADGTPTALIVDGAPVELAAGPEGPAGPAGADGAAGPEGPAGADGANFQSAALCYAYVSGAFSCDGSWKKLALDAVRFNVGNAFNTSTGTFTAPVAGYYQVSGCIYRTAGAVQLGAYIKKNGSFYMPGCNVTVNAQGVSISGLVQLAAGDTIELFAFGPAAAALYTSADGSFMSVHMVASA